jgi:RNA polymerase sigma factor (sigma-70 family)
VEWTEIYLRLQRDRNDAAAWQAMQGYVRTWAQKALWDRGSHTVDDAVADTCSTAMVSFEKAHGANTFSGFVYGHFLNVRTRALRGQIVFSIDDVDPPAPIEQEPDSDAIEMLERCLGELAHRERNAVLLRYFEDASAERIATELQVSEGNARRIVFNGLAHLRQCAARSRFVRGGESRAP